MNTSMAASASAIPDEPSRSSSQATSGEHQRGKAVQAGQPLRVGVGQRDDEGVGVIALGQEALQSDGRDLFVGHHLTLTADGHRAGDRRAPTSDLDRVRHVDALVEERAPQIVPEGVLGEHGGEGDVEAEPGQSDGHVGYPAGRDAQVGGADLGAGTGRDGQTGEHEVEADRADDVHPPAPSPATVSFWLITRALGAIGAGLWSHFLRQQLITLVTRHLVKGSPGKGGRAV